MNTEVAIKHLYKTYFGENQIEKDEIKNLPNLLVDCDVFIDVGASLGMYTYYANKILKNSLIIAIEADPDRYAELKQNCLQWEKESSNKIKALNKIVGDSKTTMTFHKTGSNISGGLFPIPDRADNYEQVTVPQVMLDEFYYPDKKTVIKVDVEGAEYRVLQGASLHFKNKHTNFLIEIHWWGDPERGTTSLDVLKFFYSKQMSIIKTVKGHRSNYFFQPLEKGQSKPVSYIKATPFLVAKFCYGRFIPRSMRKLRERYVNEKRKRKFKQLK